MVRLAECRFQIKKERIRVSVARVYILRFVAELIFGQDNFDRVGNLHDSHAYAIPEYQKTERAYSQGTVRMR